MHLIILHTKDRMPVVEKNFVQIKSSSSNSSMSEIPSTPFTDWSVGTSAVARGDAFICKRWL